MRSRHGRPRRFMYQVLYWDKRGAVELTERQERYTMLVAWHKFDQYERIQLAQICITDITKLPFQTVSYVLKCIRDYGYANRYRATTRSDLEYPISDYYKRIIRAARKVDNKRRQRIRV